MRDARDELLPPVGWVEFEDLESGERRLVDTGDGRTRERYQREAAQRLRTVSGALAQARCPLLVLHTGRPWLPVLMRYFSQRRRGRRG